MALGKKPVPVLERVLARIDIEPCPVGGLDGPCWVWAGCRNTGYGRIRVGSRADSTIRSVYVHRVVYEHLVGVVPQGLELDHLCSNRPCCNPDHLEPVTAEENIRRSDPGKVNRAKTHCLRGHPLDGDNLRIGWGGGRMCRTCLRDWTRQYRASKRSA